MDKAEQTMIDNILKNTGKSLEDWVDIVKRKNFSKHGEIIKFLKQEHSFTHGFANLIAHKARKSDAGSAENIDELVENQYKNKNEFKPIYNKIITEVKKFGADVEIAPKKASVSLRRKKQFALVQPSTKTRIDLGLKLKGKEVKGRLENSGPFGAMCTHRVRLEQITDIDKEVIDWLKEAYEEAI